MSSYRCPICGANHKDQVRQCRLCGADMTGLPIPVETALSAITPVKPNKSIKGIVAIGIILVLVLAAGAVFFGLVRSNQTVEAVKNKVASHVDGWTVQVEPDASQPPSSASPSTPVGHFNVELPGDRTRETISFVGTNDGKLVVWTAKIGTDSKLQAGWGIVTPPTPGQGPSGTSADQTPTGQNYLKDKAQAWITANGLSSATVIEQATVIAGAPAYTVKGTVPNTTLNGQPAYSQVAMMLQGNKLYVLLLTSIYKDAPQLDKMAGTFVITAA